MLFEAIYCVKIVTILDTTSFYPFFCESALLETYLRFLCPVIILLIQLSKYSEVSIIRPGRSRLLEFEIEIVLVF